VMEKYLGRYLTKKERIHHRDRNRKNNKISNLKLFQNNSKHTLFHSKMFNFLIQKRLIKQSIDNLKRAAKTLNTRGKQAELYQQVYDKLLKGANTIQEVEDRAAAVNLDAVQWMTNKWSEYYPELRDVSLKIYNTVLDEDINYTPDTISSLELDRTEDIDRPIYESPEYLNNRRLYND
ncbi:MAG: HNH endonuclease, partial [Candidatus Lokiarchaeota archaeon]|nr:HNH endonuclease [Candidatus Lokiarchaeota archaeon]